MKISSIYSCSIALIIAGLITMSGLPAYAQNAKTNFGPDIHYSPEQRFAMPVNKVTGLNGAKNVVIKEVSMSSLPDFVRIQAETVAQTCTRDSKNAKLMKFYRYTSDATREASVSANYLADLQGLANLQQDACVLGAACTQDGCLLVGYNSTAYEKWAQQFTFRQKSWTYKNIEDKKNKAILTVLELTAKCKKAAGANESGDKADQECVSKRVWLESGFVDYKDGNVFDNAAPFNDDVPEIENDNDSSQEAPATDAPPSHGEPVAPASAPQDPTN